MSDDNQPRWVKWWNHFELVASLIAVMGWIWWLFWGGPMLVR